MHLLQSSRSLLISLAAVPTLLVVFVLTWMANLPDLCPELVVRSSPFLHNVFWAAGVYPSYVELDRRLGRIRDIDDPLPRPPGDDSGRDDADHQRVCAIPSITVTRMASLSETVIHCMDAGDTSRAQAAMDALVQIGDPVVAA